MNNNKNVKLEKEVKGRRREVPTMSPTKKAGGNEGGKKGKARKREKKKNTKPK